jgi:hypothetical protein
MKPLKLLEVALQTSVIKNTGTGANNVSGGGSDDEGNC